MCVPAYQKRKNVERLMALRYDRIPILWLMNRFYPHPIAPIFSFPYVLDFRNRNHDSFPSSTANKRVLSNTVTVLLYASARKPKIAT